MIVDLAAYGVPVNPYRAALLDALLRGDDMQLLVPVDGFSGLEGALPYVKQAVADGGPLFCLIAGKNGTGRSSLANALLAAYRAERHVDNDHFIVIEEREVLDHDALRHYIRWILLLINEIEYRELDVPKDILDSIRSGTTTMGPESFESQLQGLLRRLARALSSSQAGFGVCFENVRSFSQITAAFTIFGKVPTICVFTSLDHEEPTREIVDPFRAKALDVPDARKWLPLGLLDGTDVRTLADARWSHAAAALENPFDLVGVAAAFGTRPRPIGKVLKLLTKLLQLRATLHQQGPPWPGNRALRIEESALRQTLQILEDQL